MSNDHDNDDVTDYLGDRTNEPNADSFVNAAPQPPNPNEPPFEVTPLDKLNYGTRWTSDLYRFFAVPGRAGYDYYAEEHTDLNDVNGAVSDETEMGLIFSNGGGLLVGFLFHLFCVKFNLYQNHKSVNPLYRAFKTLASAGAAVGAAIAAFLPFSEGARKFSSAIIADIASIAIGIFAIPYWLIRQYVFKINPADTRNGDHITGTEGWSKYGKTALVFGTSVGQAFAIAATSLLHFSGSSIKMAYTLWGGIAGAGSFVLALILVPVINKLTRYFNKDPALKTKDETEFRNNYIRSGITFGLAIGSFIGAMVMMAAFANPAPLMMIGITFGGALLSIAGGIAAGWKGHKLTKYIHKNWHISLKTENGWDYASRTTSLVGAAIGGLIGFFLPIPGGFIVASAVGAAFGGMVGWLTAFPIIKKARALQPHDGERQSSTLSWAQRVGAGANIGTVLGGVLGLIGGIFAGPFGIMGGAILGAAIGGVIGAAISTFIAPQATATIKRAFPSLFHDDFYYQENLEKLNKLPPPDPSAFQTNKDFHNRRLSTGSIKKDLLCPNVPLSTHPERKQSKSLGLSEPMQKVIPTNKDQGKNNPGQTTRCSARLFSKVTLPKPAPVNPTPRHRYYDMTYIRD